MYGQKEERFFAVDRTMNLEGREEIKLYQPCRGVSRNYMNELSRKERNQRSVLRKKTNCEIHNEIQLER